MKQSDSVERGALFGLIFVIILLLIVSHYSVQIDEWAGATTITHKEDAP